MGWKFRKSYKFGPFRTTISNAGVSHSFGVKGARITKRADGRTQGTLGIPGTGIYYTKDVTNDPYAPKIFGGGKKSGVRTPAENGGCLKTCLIGVAVMFLIALVASCGDGSDPALTTEPPVRDAPAIVAPVETTEPETLPTLTPTTEPTTEPTTVPTTEPTQPPTTEPAPPPTTKPKATEPPETEPPEDVYDYVLNKNTKKFHYEWCSSADDIKEKNRREFTGTREEVIAKGYEPCGRCKP